MEAGTFTTTIEAIDATPSGSTRYFRLKRPPRESFQFNAGQYLIANIPTNDEQPLQRYYSIASPPQDENFLEICVRLNDNSEASDYLRAVKVGEPFTISAPRGTFQIQTPVAKDLLFISTGTGITPLRSMMLSLLTQKASASLWNIFGNRFSDEILYLKEFERLEERHAQFHNIFTVSQAGENAWEGEREYVQNILKAQFADPADKQIYICGLSEMKKDVIETARALGYTDQQIFFEKY